MCARINLLSANPADAQAISKSSGLPSFIATTLAARGFTTPEQVQEFLSPSLDRDWLDPYGIEGMAEAVDVIADAIRNGKRIVVFGDFDLDGISATTLLTRGLRAVQGNVTPFIPLRFEEGYGLTEAAINRMLECKPDLVITVDNGIAAKHEVERLKGLGVEVVITDHHEPSDLVPEGVPVVDPKCPGNQGCLNPSAILAGAGVALKVVQAVGSRFGALHAWKSLIDLATLGTVADLMPMRGENRALVAEGIALINENPRPCLAALLGESGFANDPVSSSNLGFTIVPRLNAAGRMGNAQLALDLLMCDDFAEACHLARELEETNTRRRTIEAELAEVASSQAEESYKGERALVVAGEGWHEGVKGIVASRLVSRYGVPSILFTIEGNEARGSGRSVGEVNLFKAVSSCQDLLIRFGGHGAAVGVTLLAENLPEFKKRLCAYMDTLPKESFIPKINVDAQVCLDELNLETVAMLERIAPFGQENPTPRFLAHGVMLQNPRAVGAEKNHLSCSLSDGSGSLACIMFHVTDINEKINCPCAMDAVFELQIDTWKGRRSVKAVLSSLEPVSPCAALEACLEGEDREFLDGLMAHDEEAVGKDAQPEPQPGEDRALWEQYAASDPQGFRAHIVAALVGEHELHASQDEALRLLDGGQSVLALMGTGRGKSLIFQTYAAQVALGNHRVSIFVYPLRALVSDQAFNIGRTLGAFGIRSCVLTGATPEGQRQRFYEQAAKGEVDIVLTTPEYLECHASSLASALDVGFVVVDEAHHVGTSKAGFRPAYKRLGAALGIFGNPQVLAVSATVNEEAKQVICSTLNITGVVVDNARRANLHVEDMRNVKKRDAALVNVVNGGEKTLVYVNSRKESVVLARQLRTHAPHVASMVGFYHAGLAREERDRIEEMFRTGKLQVLVATSAFGEGIDIPGIRHVVLYHMPFSEIDFNQMSGRAGRDGNDAFVHLLYGREDVARNSALLGDVAPNHECMGLIYRELRRLQRSADTDFFPLQAQDVAAGASGLLNAGAITSGQVHCGVAVFEELGLMKTQMTDALQGQAMAVNVVDYNGKVELTDSVRYREGIDELETFQTFKEWALGSTVDQVTVHVQHPLLPEERS